MSEKKTLDKKPIRDLLTEKDAFLTTSEKMQEYLLRHTKGAIIIVAVVALAVIGTALYLNHQEKAESEATEAYENSLTQLAASENDGVAALEKVRTDFAARKASRLAAFRLLGVYVANKNTDKALPLAEELLKTIKPAEASLKPALLSNLGGLYEDKKDYQQAAKSYETLLAMDYLKNTTLEMEVLMSLGRVYAAADRKDDAVRNYERVISDYPLSPQAFMANSKLAELKGVPVAFPLPGNDQLAAAVVQAEAPADVSPPAGEAVETDSPAAGSDGDGASPATAPETAESAGAAPAAEGAPQEQAADEEVEVEEGAPLPPNVAPHEDPADGQATVESGAE